MQCTYNETFMARSRNHFCHAKARSSKYECVCVCSCFSYPECKSHLFCVDMYCHLLPVWLDHIFPLYLTNGTNFRQKLYKHKMRVLICTQLSSVTSLFLRRIGRDIIINVHWALCKLPVILVVF